MPICSRARRFSVIQRCSSRRQLDFYSFLKDMSPFIPQTSSFLDMVRRNRLISCSQNSHTYRAVKVTNRAIRTCGSLDLLFLFHKEPTLNGGGGLRFNFSNTYSAPLTHRPRHGEMRLWYM
ncbi:hypothetical protein ATANTOWER_014080 [Ataeniobius toweri]|uniref:Uncharacterized protein n=1 Tax=Ataeniobius toweri TaxID=208326 RepID=A0ABU7B9I5_9TELE|nr:hypothetical protein [Ataeniobius toweri]